ncbi:putative development/cell death domain-containing protein [Dioscorea sansibarensis]
MEHDLERNPSECDSTLTGAIFMSNRATKKECLKRGVFGLPQSQAKFVSELKAGMLLFLFEHEERKLYGVFEAISDGAMNIIPNAFCSSGMLFPAQIIFKRIWACKPLCESEFGDCIRENYYTPNKFHFGLSLKQVMRLLGLFSLKKINVGEPQSLISKSSVVKTKSTGKDTLLDSEYNAADASHSFGNGSLYGHNPGAMYYEYPPASEDHMAVVKHERRFHPSVQCASDGELPNFSHAATEIDGVLGRGFPVSQFHHHDFYDVFPGSVGKQSSAAVVSSGHSVPPELATHARSSPVIPGPYFSSPSSSSKQRLEGTNFPYNDYPNLDVSSRGIIDNPLKPVYEPFRGHLPSNVYLPLNFSSNHITHEGLSSVYEPSRTVLDRMSSLDNSNFQDHNNTPFPECFNLTTSQNHLTAPGLFGTKAEEMSGLVLSPGKLHDYPFVTQPEDFSREYWQRRFTPSDYIPLSIDERLPRNMEHSSLSSSPIAETSDMQYGHSSYFLEDNDYERDYKKSRPSNPAPGNKYCSSYAKPFNSDTFRKTSVFSRLSWNPLHDRQGRAHLIDNSVTLDQLAKLLSQRKKQWNKKKGAKQSFQQHDYKQLECVLEMEPSDSAFAAELESDNVASTKEKTDVPFFNFKRRSETCKVEHEVKTNCDNSSDKGRHKRRRLVRPSFDEDEQPFLKENSHSKRLSQRTGEIKVLEINGQDSGTQIGDSSVTSSVENRNEMSYPESNQGSLAFGKARKIACELRDLCDARRTDEQDLVKSDDTVKILSMEANFSTRASTKLNLGKKTEEKPDMLADESSIALVHMKCKAQKTKEVHDRNMMTFSDLGAERISVKIYDECCKEACGNVNGREVERESHVSSHGNLLIQPDAKYGNTSNDVDQRNAEGEKAKVEDNINVVVDKDSSMPEEKLQDSKIDSEDFLQL